MAIRKICIVNVQLVKGNFAASKHYHLKLSTRKFIILNFELVKSSFQARKTNCLNFQLIKQDSQLANYFLKFAIHKKQLATPKKQLAGRNFIFKSQNKFATHKITSQLIKKHAFRNFFS